MIDTHMMPCNVKQMFVKLRTLNECDIFNNVVHIPVELTTGLSPPNVEFQFSDNLLVSMIGSMTGFVPSWLLYCIISDRQLPFYPNFLSNTTPS